MKLRALFRLRGLLVLLTLAATVGAVGLVNLAWEQSLQVSARKRAQETLAQDLHKIQGDLEYLLGQPEAEEVKRRIFDEALDPRAELVILVDAEGIIRRSSQRSYLGRPMTEVPDVEASWLQEGGETHQIHWVDQGGGHLVGHAPVQWALAPGELRATRFWQVVKVVNFEEDLAEAEAQAHRIMGWMMGWGILLGLVLMGIHRRWISRRVERLLTAATAIGEGQLDARSGVRGWDELADLGVALDQMAQRLSDESTTREALQSALVANLHELMEFRHALDQAAIISLTDAEGRITHVNDAFLALSGYTREELVGSTHRVVKSGQHPEAFYAAMWEALAHGRAWKGELQNRRKDGTPYWVDSVIIPFRGSSQAPEAYLDVSFDITDRKRMESERQLIAEERRALLDAASVGRLVPFQRISGQRVLELGGAAREVLGVDPEEVRARPEFLLTLLDPEGLGQLNAVLEEPADRPRTFLARRAGVRPIQWLEWTVQREGETLRGVIQDVSERQELEDRFRQSQRMESLGTLASGIAHDFNNLLTALMGSLDVIGLDKTLSERHRARLDTMTRAVQRGQGLVSQLSSFGRRSSPDWAEVDLNQLVREVQVLAASALPPKVQLLLELDPDLPKGHMDQGQVHQALMNLVINARDAVGESGTIRIRTSLLDLHDGLRLGTRRPGTYFGLEVQDDGPGIPPELRARIFEPFFTTKPVGKGTGLGLSVVYGVAERHRGLLELTSAPGEGATFRILIPRMAQEQNLSFTGIFQPGSPSLALAAAPGAVRDSVQDILEALGHGVILLDGLKNANAVAELPRGVLCAPDRVPFLLPWLGPDGPWRGVPWCCLGPLPPGPPPDPPPLEELSAAPQVIDILKALGRF